MARVYAGVAALALLALCGGACVTIHGRHREVALPRTIGVPSDVTTQAGTAAGYEISDSCHERDVLLGVRVHGHKRVAPGLQDGWDDEMIALRDRAERALSDVAIAVWWAGSCRGDELSLHVVVASYSDVDAAVTRVSAFLTDEDRGDPAAIELYHRLKDRPYAAEFTGYTPRANPPFWPYEVALAAGARHDDRWNATFALHLGYIWGNARGPSLDGWFWGIGLDGGAVDGVDGTQWSGGPVLRTGWGFGPVRTEHDWPTEGTNRVTYIYPEAGMRWGVENVAAKAALGFTSLAPIQYYFLHQFQRRAWHVLLFPLFVFNHVELEIDSRGDPSFLIGFSL